ncbi:MAG: hypothetical protein H7Z14_16220 [Anaerolineae bacterium]|nr:hypothetical protein [Phycisphaerae bacterium]
MSIVIIAVMMTAALQTVSQSNLMQFRMLERARAQELARLLTNEILPLAYQEPVSAISFGAEAGETRATFDDVDDYNGLSESPLTYRDATAMGLPGPATWRRTVTVVWVDPSTLADASPQVESGAKKITVTVYHRGFAAATLSTIRTNAP